jgi:hypothetical protein
MNDVQVWDTGYLAEKYFESTLHRFRQGKSLWLVGVKTTREHRYYQETIDHGGMVVIVEPFAANVEWSRPVYPAAEIFHGTIQSALDTFFQPPDILIWLQGPEHVDKTIALGILERCRVHGTWVIAEMPHGIHEQGPDGGNELERHVSYLYPYDFDPTLWGRAVGPENKAREHSPTVNQHLLVWALSRG